MPGLTFPIGPRFPVFFQVLNKFLKLKFISAGISLVPRHIRFSRFIAPFSPFVPHRDRSLDPLVQLISRVVPHGKSSPVHSIALNPSLTPFRPPGFPYHCPTQKPDAGSIPTQAVSFIPFPGHTSLLPAHTHNL
jgi:hypothetical protein